MSVESEPKCELVGRVYRGIVANRDRYIAELEEQITAYQTRVDNDLLRLKAAYSLAGSE